MEISFQLGRGHWIMYLYISVTVQGDLLFGLRHRSADIYVRLQKNDFICVCSKSAVSVNMASPFPDVLKVVNKQIGQQKVTF